ncbi:MAG TPA: HD-GYP domain-containing protein [Gemmatimonadaceae bacterium]|nr:HD-GYP domain-containing protein [Gemmatimonadaceae bacterium]
MSTPVRMQPPPSFGEAGGDSYLRRTGRTFMMALYGALRAIKLYPVENAAVQMAIEELQAVAAELVRREQELEFRASGEFIFVNATRLRLDLDNYASFSHLLSVFRANGVGTLRVTEAPPPKQWLTILSILQSQSREAPSARFAQLAGKLEQTGIRGVEFGPASETEDDPEYREKAKEAAKRTYGHSVAATRDVINSVRMGRSPNIKKIKRAVQSIVDQILNEEESLIGLTTIRDYDEYTFTHSVNVCIFSVALGRRLGLSKLQLYDLGMAALFHDLGKSRVPVEVLNKTGGLNDDEWRIIMAHPWLGVLALFQVRGSQDLPYRSMVVAFEHHMKIDLTGYPRTLRPRTMSIFSKIVAAADGFDAATSRRVYQTEPLTPAVVLQEMRDNPRRGMDPIVVKAFINLVGIYPVGTLVVLDTFELAIVHAASQDQEMISRPVVRIISDDKGNLNHPGELMDLSARNADGAFLRTIIKTTDPDRYGIRVADYFV